MKQKVLKELKELLIGVGYTVMMLVGFFVVFYLAVLWIGVIVLLGGHIPI